jgi:hypothetical protein
MIYKEGNKADTSSLYWHKINDMIELIKEVIMKIAYEKPFVRDLGDGLHSSVGQTDCRNGSAATGICGQGDYALAACENGNWNRSGLGCINGNNNAGGPGFACNNGNNNETGFCQNGGSVITPG